jgi:hypothetical protein
LLPTFIIDWDKIGTKIYNVSHELKRLAVLPTPTSLHISLNNAG